MNRLLSIIIVLVLSGCSYSTALVGEFGRYNEAFIGEVAIDGLSGGATMTATTTNSGLTCSGIATPGITGLIDLTCNDGRRLSGRYQSTNGGMGKGFGQGQDQYGNVFQFRYGMSQEEAKKIGTDLVTKKQGRPPLPSGDAAKIYLFAYEPADGIESFWEKAKVLRADCAKERKGGSIQSYLAEDACSRDSIRTVYSNGQYPHMDLVDLLIAHRTVMAEQADKGKISQAEFQMREFEIVSKLNTAVMQREEASRNTSQQQTVVINRGDGLQRLGNAMNDLNQELQIQNMQNQMNRMQWDFDIQGGYNQTPQIYSPGVPSGGGITCQFGC